MARSNHVYERPLRSYEELTRRSYRTNNKTSEEAAVLRFWRTPSIQRIVRTLQAMEACLDHSNCIYDRSVLLMFCVVTLVLRKNRRQAHRFVQESDTLRREVGLPPLDRRLRSTIDAAEDDQDVLEPGFPVRQMISESVDWIERWLTTNTGLLDDVNGLDFMSTEAYEEVVVDTLARHSDVRADVCAIDGKRIPSPTNHPDRKRADPGASYLPRKHRGKPNVYGRIKFTAGLGDVPLIICSDFSNSPNELSFCQTEFIPQFISQIERLRDRSADAPSLAGLNGALVCGDGALANSKVIEELRRNKLLTGFRKPNGLVRVLDGQRTVTNRRKGITTILDACTNGDHFCDCDAVHHEDECEGKKDCGCRPAELWERTPMFQELHDAKIGGGVYVYCDNAACCRRGMRFYVPYRKPDLDKKGRPTAPEQTYDLVLPTWRGDIRYHATVFKATQAIEHYHGHLYTLLGLSTESGRDGRRVSGDFAHRFWFTLADLIWNLNVGFNLDRMKRDGRKRRDINWIDLWHNAVAQWHNVWRSTDGQRQPDESEREWRERIKHPPHIGRYFLGSQQIC